MNPYDGSVTGSYLRSREFFNVVLKIHRTLFAGTLGRLLMELATCWGIVLLVTGVYLWCPKNFRKLRGVLVPRLGGKPYMTLRDLHAIPAVYLSVLLLLVMATGLFFTNVWGTGFRAATLATGGFPESFVSPPVSTRPADGPVAPLSLHDVVTKARYGTFALDELSVSMPHSETEPISVAARASTGPSLAGMLYLDQYSGEILDYLHSGNVPAMTKLMLYALPIHQGSIFGLPTKLMAFAAAVMLIVSTITGAWMWWRRRPKGSFGTPRRYDDASIPTGIIALIVVLGVADASGWNFAGRRAVGGPRHGMDARPTNRPCLPPGKSQVTRRLTCPTVSRARKRASYFNAVLISASETPNNRRATWSRAFAAPSKWTVVWICVPVCPLCNANAGLEVSSS